MLRKILAISGLVGVLAMHVNASAQDVHGIGMIKASDGGVQVLRANAPSAAVAGQRLMQGDQLRTGDTGSTTVMLRDGTVVALGPKSTVDLSRFQFNSTTQEGSLGVKLVQGSIRMVTGLIAKLNPEAVKVETPTALIGVRGTDFIVEFSPGDTKVQ